MLAVVALPVVSVVSLITGQASAAINGAVLAYCCAELIDGDPAEVAHVATGVIVRLLAPAPPLALAITAAAANICTDIKRIWMLLLVDVD
jgi:hypothetical protein